MSLRAVTFEYSKFDYEIVEDHFLERFEDGKLYLTEKSIEELEKLNFFEVGRKKIRVLNYAGVVGIGKIRLEILPKFLRKSYKPLQLPEDVKERGIILSNLFEMLKRTNMFKVKDVSLTSLSENDDFFEIFVYIFAKNLLSLLKSKIDAGYVRKKNELSFVKGKIDVRRYISSTNLCRIPCTFYERLADTPINRTLKYVCYLLSSITSSKENYRLLRQILAIFDLVTLTPVSVSYIRKINFNRLNIEFKPFINFCELFLSSSSISLQGENVEFFSIVFPMEKLFEEFLAEVISQRFFKGRKLQIQKSIGYFVTKPRGFKLIPDIVVSGDEVYVIDTKYKLLEPEDKKYGISQQDLYQIYAYCRELNAKKALLIYPRELNGENVERDLTLRDRIDVFVRTISLDRDLRNWEEFVEELSEVLACLES